MYGGGLNDAIALSVAEHPLTANASYLAFYADNGVPLRLQTGLELIRAAGRPLVALVEYGEQGGQVLVIADLGILQVGGDRWLPSGLFLFDKRVNCG